MYQKTDGRLWSRVVCNGTEFEMLWDSGASVSVMDVSCWKEMGGPPLKPSSEKLMGAFSSGSGACLGKSKINVQWGHKQNTIEVYVVKGLVPVFIGGIDIMKMFGVYLKEVFVMETQEAAVQINTQLRVDKALNIFASKNIHNLIRQYGDIFMASTFDLGHTTVLKHHIKTTGSPVAINQRRLPLHLETEVNILIKQLLENQVIKPCQSPWNSQLVVVKKKDNNIRMCLDFRPLNAITEKFTFPVPDIYGLLDALSGAVMFSSIDLGSAYY